MSKATNEYSPEEKSRVDSSALSSNATQTKMTAFTTARHSSTLPTIDTGIGDLTEITDLAWKAVLQANETPYLFRHGGNICRLESNELEIPIIRNLTPTRLRHELARVARWIAVKD